MADRNLQSFIVDYSLQLLQQDMLTNSLFMGSATGKTLRDLVLKEASVPLRTDPTAKALSGTLRVDAGMLRQASKNVAEAQSIMDTGASAMNSIKDILADMKDIADEVAAGTMTTANAKPLYKSLRDEMRGIISSTSYNGISLLDGTNWGTDSRMTTSGSGTTLSGSLRIQSGSDGFDLALLDMKSDLYNAYDDGTADLANAAAAAATATRLSTDSTTVTTIADLYAGRSSSIAGHSAALAKQADIMDAAAIVREKGNDGRTTEELLLDLILRASGTLVDENG